MDYKVVITIDAENDFIRHIRYILEKFYNDQAAKSVADDFEETKNSLAKSAGSLQYCTNPKLRELGYKRINYLHHDYFLHTLLHHIQIGYFIILYWAFI